MRFVSPSLARRANKPAADVAKDYPDGKRHHIEYLVIGPDAMTGPAKYDGHKLNHRRLKGVGR